MRVVGVDQSYTGFGYCVGGQSKKKSFPISNYSNDVARLAEIRVWFGDWLNSLLAPVDLVVMEGYANAAKFGREAAGELGAVVKLAVYDCHRMVTPYPLIVPPTSLKKFVTGKGNAKKNEMLLGVYKKWGVEFSDDNQADAFALEKFGYAYLDSQWTYQYEADAIEAVRKSK